MAHPPTLRLVAALLMAAGTPGCTQLPATADRAASASTSDVIARSTWTAPAILVPTPLESPRDPRPSPTPTLPAGVSLPRSVAITVNNIGSLRAILDLEQQANGVAWAPDGSSIALATSNWIHLLSVPSLEPLAMLVLKDETVIDTSFRSVAFHPGGDRVAAVGGYLQQWSLPDESPYGQYVSAGSPITTVDFSPDGSLIAFGFDSGAFVAPSDYSSAQTILRPGEFNYFVPALAFSPSAPQLASVSDDGHIRIWDVTTGQQLAELGSASGVDVAFSPGGSSIVSGGRGPITLWNPSEGASKWESPIPAGLFIDAVEFDPGGSILAAALSDGTVLFLDVLDGSRLHELAVTGTPSSLVFHPDGTYLAVVGAAGEVRILAIAD